MQNTMYYVEEEEAYIDNYWRHIEEEAAIDNYYNYWSEEAQILSARDRAASIIQNNWKKSYNRRRNDFRNISLVTDPTTYGTSTVATSSTYRQVSAAKLTSVTGTFTPDEKISQASTGAIGKVVEWDSTLSILYYQQERYADYGTNSTTGAFVAFSGANAITGASSSAAGTPDATADSAVTLANDNTITFSDGYANPELQPDSGNIIYQENRKPISRATDQTEDIKIIVEF